MVKHHKRLIVGLGVGFAVGAVAIASFTYISPISPASSEATDNVRVVEDRKLPEQWAINAAYGRGALSNLRAAINEIESDNTEEAKKGVAVAQSLLAKIKLMPPDGTVTPSGSSATSASPDYARAATDLILVHSEVRLLGDADPINSVQAKLDDIRHEHEMNDHEAIIAALGSLNIPLAYTRIDLPLGETMTLINESLRALDSRDADQARSKLMQVGNGLRIETVHVGVGNSPHASTNVNDAS